MYLISYSGYEVWKDSSLEDIREALRRKSLASMKNLKLGLRSHRTINKDDGQYAKVRALSIDDVHKEV